MSYEYVEVVGDSSANKSDRNLNEIRIMNEPTYPICHALVGDAQQHMMLDAYDMRLYQYDHILSPASAHSLAP